MLQLKNNAYGLLNDTIASGDTVPITLTLTAGHGARFPTLAAGQHFIVCLTDDPPTKMEYMLVTARSTDDLTVSARALGGTTAQNWAVNARVSIRWDMMQALEFERIGGGNSYIAAGGTAAAITGSVQTLLTGLYDGMEVVLKMSGSTGPNTVSNPTFTLTLDASAYGGASTGTGAKTIYGPDGMALSPGNIGGNNTLITLRYSSGLNGWILRNPYTPPGSMASVWGLKGANDGASPTTKFDFTTYGSTVRNTSNGFAFVRPALSRELDISTVGADGRDQTSAFGSGATIHIYHIFDGTNDRLVASLGDPSTGPNGAQMPAGYTAWCYLTSMVLSGTNLPVVYVRGASVFFEEEKDVVNTSSVPTTEQTASVSTLVPAIATEYELHDDSYTGPNVGGGNSFLYFRVKTGVNHTYRWNIAATATANLTHNATVRLPNVGQQFFWLWTHSSTNASSSTNLKLPSYRVPNGDV